MPDSFQRKPIASRRIADAPRSRYPSSTSVSSSSVRGCRTSTSTWSSPNVVHAQASLPSGRGYGVEQGSGARTGHARDVEVRLALDVEAVVRRVAREPAPEPRAAARGVVGDEVEHQVVLAGQVGHVRPGAEGRVDLAVVDDGEPVVGRPREHRQQVHVADHVADVVVQEARQRVQRRLVGAPDAVAVRDQARGQLGRRSDVAAVQALGVRRRHGHQPAADVLVLVGVEQLEVRRDAAASRQPRSPELLRGHPGAVPDDVGGERVTPTRRRPAGRGPRTGPTRRAPRPGRRTTAARRTRRRTRPTARGRRTTDGRRRSPGR